MTKIYNWEQTRVKIPKPDRGLPENLEQFEEFELWGQVFGVNYVLAVELAGSIPIILMNS